MIHVWALIDPRPGTASQVLGVARQSQGVVIEKTLTYNRFADLPNFCMIGNGLRGLARSGREQIQPPWPDVVISAGRRSAPVAVAIKQRHASVKLVHLMHPNMPLQCFDMVLLPSHDTALQHPVIVTTLGAPHGLSDELLFTARARIPLNPDLFPRPWTLLALGGNTTHGTFTLADVERLVEQCAPLAESGTVFLTGSRRTAPALLFSALERLRVRYPTAHVEPYRPEQQEENPYAAWLAQVERIVVTADSVSMVSEAAFTGKPVYVFMPSAAASPKHQRFIEDMVRSDHVKMLESYEPLWRGGVRLDEARRIGRLIRAWFEPSV
jgi:uncharacterized protein